MQNTQLPPVNTNFIKSLIKIANPDWSADQVEAEAQKKLAEMANPTDTDGCEFCSG